MIRSYSPGLDKYFFSNTSVTLINNLAAFSYFIGIQKTRPVLPSINSKCNKNVFFTFHLGAGRPNRWPFFLERIIKQYNSKHWRYYWVHLLILGFIPECRHVSGLQGSDLVGWWHVFIWDKSCKAYCSSVLILFAIEFFIEQENEQIDIYSGSVK